MGKIKGENLLRKKDRPTVEPKPPSMRRIKRSNRKAVPRQGTFAQVIGPTVMFRFKRKHRPTEVVVHEHYSDEREDVTSERTLIKLTCSPDDSAKVAQFKLMADQGLGKLVTTKRKVIWHRVDKQDNHYKPTLPYYRGSTGKR